MRAAMRLRTAILDQADDDELLRGARARVATAALRLRPMLVRGTTGGVALRRPRACRGLRRPGRALTRDAPPRAAALGLPLGDFRCRFAVASLHLWLTLVRLRAEGDEGKRLGQARPRATATLALARPGHPCTPRAPQRSGPLR